jgi:hypothetical protein
MLPLARLLAVLATTGGAQDTARSSVDEIVACLERTEGVIRNLSVTTEYVKFQKDEVPVSEPVRMRFTTAFIVEGSGRARYECVGEQVNVGPMPGEVRTFRGRWRATFDGQVATTLRGSIDGAFISAEIDRWPAWHGVNPLEYTTHNFGEPVSLKTRSALDPGASDEPDRVPVLPAP